MRIRRLGAVALLAAALAAPVPAAAAAAPFGDGRGSVAPSGDGRGSAALPRDAAARGAASRHATAASCRPGTPANAMPTGQFFEGRAFLGPAVLPTDSPVTPLLRHYLRLGYLRADTFIRRYRDGDQWRYPPADGFLTWRGRPIKHAVALRPGSLVDRFGYPGGAYLSPAGTPFAARALPPQNLDTPVAAPLSNYHEYCVLRRFRVDSGPIAPWFAQPGLGIQFKLNGDYLPTAGTALNLTWLLGHGFLVEENPADQNPADQNPADQNPAEGNPTTR